MSKDGVRTKVLELVENKAPWIGPATIFLSYHGSRAYGTNIESSDIDVRGFYVPPLKVISDPYDSTEQVGHHDKEYDVIIFDCRKFLKLASQGNPNIIESFWVEKENWLWTTPSWEKVYSKREQFLSKELCKRFMGYALGEFRALKTGIANGVGPDNTRYSLYEKYGYDSKAALHSARVSRMCKEIALGGKVVIRRPDAEELKRIRLGQCSIEDVILEIEDNLIEAGKGLEKSDLPEVVDKNFIRGLSRELLTEHLYGGL